MLIPCVSVVYSPGVFLVVMVATLMPTTTVIRSISTACSAYSVSAWWLTNPVSHQLKKKALNFISSSLAHARLQQGTI